MREFSESPHNGLTEQRQDMKYKDIFLDFDDTLYDTRGNAAISLHEIFVKYRLDRYFNDEHLFAESYWNTNVILWSMYAKGEIERDFLMVERFRRPLSEGVNTDDTPFTPDKELCLSINNDFLELNACKEGLVEGARELVSYLKDKGYRLHICSNGFREVQYRKLRACGLYDFFDNIILSEQAGANKPNKAFFDYALKVTKAERTTTVMVGDNFYTDITGAAESGLHTIFFNAHPEAFTAPQLADHEVNRLTEIIGIL